VGISEAGFQALVWFGSSKQLDEFKDYPEVSFDIGVGHRVFNVYTATFRTCRQEFRDIAGLNGNYTLDGSQAPSVAQITSIKGCAIAVPNLGCHSLNASSRYIGSNP
jgi:hypothetical protein